MLYFEGEKNGELRFLRANKNRFGNTEEIECLKWKKWNSGNWGGGDKSN